MVIYTGQYTKIMQKNYNYRLISKTNLPFNKVSRIKCWVNEVCKKLFFASLVYSILLLVIASGPNGDLGIIQVVLGSGSSYTGLVKLLLHIISFNLELLPLGITTAHDTLLFFSCLAIENRFSRFIQVLRQKWHYYKSVKRQEKFLGSGFRNQRMMRVNLDSPGKPLNIQTIIRTELISQPTQKKPPAIGKKTNLRTTYIRTSDTNLGPNPGSKMYVFDYETATGGTPGAEFLTGYKGNEEGGFSIRSKTFMASNRTVFGSSGYSSSQTGSHLLPRVINFPVMSNLGCLDHVVFDKTDTLTSNTLEITKMATVERCYAIDPQLIGEKLLEAKAPGNELLSNNDSQEEAVKESEEYSEKSQEYLEEIEGEFCRKVLDEDSTWSECMNIIQNAEDYKELQKQLSTQQSGLQVEPESKSVSQNEEDYLPVNKDMDSNQSIRLNSPPKEYSKFSIPITEELGSNRPNRSKVDGKNSISGSLEKKAISKLRLAVGLNNTKHANAFTDSVRAVTQLAMLEGNLHDTKSNSSELEGIPPITLKPNKEHSFDKFIRDMYIKREEMERFFTFITLLNKFTLEGEKNSKAQAIEDKAISEILRSLGYRTQTSAKTHRVGSIVEREHRIKCITTNHIADFLVVGVNFYSNIRERMSIVFQDIEQTLSGDAYLLVKGNDQSLKSVLNMKDKEKNVYRELLANYKNSGLKPIVYAIRRMDPDEVTAYREEYLEIMKSSRDQVEGYERLASEVEERLSFCGCFGIRDNVSAEAITISQKLKTAGLKVSILSGDARENCINVAQALKLLDSGLDGRDVMPLIYGEKARVASNLQRILERIYEDIKKLNQEEMKSANEEKQIQSSEYGAGVRLVGGMENDELSTLWKSLFETSTIVSKGLARRSGDHEGHESLGDLGGMEDPTKLLDLEIENSGFKNLTKKTLVLNGGVMSVIFKSKVLLKQFRSVLKFANCIIGFEMQPSHKALVVKLLKHQGETIMAVGDGFNDIGMIKEANISVQVTNTSVPVVFSDLVIPNIGSLDKLIFKDGFQIFRASIDTFLIFTWLSLSLVSLPYTAYYQSSGFSGYSSFTSRAALIFFGLLIVFDRFSNPVYSGNILQKLPALYREHEAIQRHFSTLVLGIIFLAILEILITTVMLGLFIQSQPNSKGYLPGIQQYKYSLNFTTLVNAALKIWLWSLDAKISIIVMISAIMISISLLEYTSWRGLDLADYFDLWDFLKDPTIFMALFICISVPSLINFSAIAIVRRIILNSGVVHVKEIYAQIKKKVSEVKSHSLISESKLTTYIASRVNQFMDLGRDKRFRVTLMLQSLLLLNESSPSTVITKILSVDLFNFQFGMKPFINYIVERVERKSFREYLQFISMNHALAQFRFYLVIFLGGFAVGLSTPEFRYNFMLDSTITYAVVGLATMCMTLGSDKLISSQHTTLLCFGCASLLYTISMSIFSYNRFDWNIMDTYSVRIWFTVLFDLVESSILVVAHIIVKVAAAIVRFDQPNLYLSLGALDYSQALISLLLYYTFLLMLKAKVRNWETNLRYQ